MDRPEVVQRIKAQGSYKGIPYSVGAPQVHPRCLELVRKHVPAGARVLDLGGGYGAFSRRLLDEGYEVEACELDPSEWMVPEVRVMKLDLNEPAKDLPGPYDCIAAIEVIEHLHNPYKFLRDCREMLVQAGVLVLSTPNVLDIDSRRIFLRSGHFYAFRKDCVKRSGHTTILPAWLLEEILEVERFEVVERVFCGERRRPWPKSWLSPVLNAVLFPFASGVPRAGLLASQVLFVIRPEA